MSFRFFEGYILTPLDMYNALSHVYLSNQKEESISIQRVNYEACKLPCIFASGDCFYLSKQCIPQ